MISAVGLTTGGGKCTSGLINFDSALTNESSKQERITADVAIVVLSLSSLVVRLFVFNACL